MHNQLSKWLMNLATNVHFGSYYPVHGDFDYEVDVDPNFLTASILDRVLMQHFHFSHHNHRLFLANASLMTLMANLVRPISPFDCTPT